MELQLLLCLLAGICVGLYLFRIFQLTTGISLHVKMTQSLDAVVLVAVITRAITLVNSFYSRSFDQKNSERRYLAAK